MKYTIYTHFLEVLSFIRKSFFYVAIFYFPISLLSVMTYDDAPFLKLLMNVNDPELRNYYAGKMIDTYVLLSLNLGGICFIVKKIYISLKSFKSRS